MYTISPGWGFNAYRIHIWDVEISDQQGNLIENKHLNLLDYPDRPAERTQHSYRYYGNDHLWKWLSGTQPTDRGLLYLYDKCEVHDHPDGRSCTGKLYRKLVSHTNPYTGKAYMNDPAIIGFEINNEPCHAGNAATNPGVH